jgi:hypothetical protein
MHPHLTLEHNRPDSRDENHGFFGCRSANLEASTVGNLLPVDISSDKVRGVAFYFVLDLALARSPDPNGQVHSETRHGIRKQSHSNFNYRRDIADGTLVQSPNEEKDDLDLILPLHSIFPSINWPQNLRLFGQLYRKSTTISFQTFTIEISILLRAVRTSPIPFAVLFWL